MAAEEVTKDNGCNGGSSRKLKSNQFPVSVINGTHSGWLISLVKLLSHFPGWVRSRTLIALFVTNVNSMML